MVKKAQEKTAEIIPVTIDTKDVKSLKKPLLSTR